MKKLFLLWILCSSLLLGAQDSLTNTSILEDYQIFKKIIKEAHPCYDAYTSKEKWDSLFLAFEQNHTQLHNTRSLYKEFYHLADHLKDGHFRLFDLPTVDINQMFPLILKCINGKLYTDTDDFGVPLGAEIISINGVSTTQIMTQLLKYAPSDGYSMTKKYREIELKFGVFYQYEFGLDSMFQITYETPNHDVIEVNISSQPFETIKWKNVNRSTYFANFHHQADRVAHFKKFINNHQPFLHYIDSLETAILTVHSFGIDVRAFKSTLVSLFIELKKKKTKHLIVDVRLNEGGFRPNAIHLLSFLIDQSLDISYKTHIKCLDIPYRNHIDRTYLNIDTFYTKEYESHPSTNGWSTTRNGAAYLLVPHKKRFKGDVHVLIGGATFSAASIFAMYAQKSSKIKIVGEEPGGGYQFHTGDFPVYYTLPHSKIKFALSMVQLFYPVRDQAHPKGRGLFPDIECSVKREDILEGTDAALSYILQHLTNE